MSKQTETTFETLDLAATEEINGGSRRRYGGFGGGPVFVMRGPGYTFSYGPAPRYNGGYGYGYGYGYGHRHIRRGWW